MKLYVVRHGETLWNKEDPFRFQGWADIELSEDGVNQARKLGERLAKEKIKMIYSSPLKRAKDTAKEISKFHSESRIIIEPDLIELGVDFFDGLNAGQIKKKFPEVWELREKDKWNYRVGKGESYSDMDLRVKRFLKKIIKENNDCFVVAHGALIKVLFMAILDKSYAEINKNFFGNTSLSIFEIIPGQEVKVILFNCNKHLEDK